MKNLISVTLAVALFFSFINIAHAAGQITKDQYYARSASSGNELE